MKYRYQLGKKHYETAQTTTAAILLLPTLIALTFLFLIPVVRLFSLSLTSTNTITNQSTYIGLKNYAYLLKNAMFQKAFGNTLFFTVTKLALEIVISLVLAVMLDMYIPWRKFLRISYFLPVIVPVVASSIIWMWLYDPAIGPLNQLLRFLGLPTSNYIYAESSALMSIVAFAVWRGIGYDIIIFISGLQGISDSVVEAARIDGANERTDFPPCQAAAAFPHCDVRRHDGHDWLLPGLYRGGYHDRRRPQQQYHADGQLHLYPGLWQRQNGPRRGSVRAAVCGDLPADDGAEGHERQKGA